MSVTGGCIGEPGYYKFTLDVGGGAPAAPSNLTVTAVDPNHIRLDWQANSNNQTGFQINNGVVSRNVGATSTTYTWGGLAPSTYMCFKIRAYNSVGASAWDPSVSPFYVCTTTPAAPPKPVVVSKTALSADTVMGVTVMASFSPAGAGGRLKLNYLWFDASAPGVRCDAGISAKGIRIVSSSKTVWQVATGPKITFGPGIGGSSKNAYIYLYGNPAVYVTGGKAFITIGFNLFSSLLSQSGCGDATLDTISMKLPIP